MDLTKYKYLVVSGDSFTQGHIQGEQASWAYWTAKELGLELVNLAIGGMSNDWIYKRPFKWFNENKDKISESICMICWSDFGRQYTTYQPVIETPTNTRWITNIAPGDLLDDPGFNVNDNDVPAALKYMYTHRETLKPYFGSIQDALFRTLESQLIVREYLESVNIPFAFFDAITLNKVNFDDDKNEWWLLNTNGSKLTIPKPTHDYSDDIKELINKKTISHIFDKHYFDFEGQSIAGCYNNWPGGSEVYEKGNGGHTNIETAKIFAKMIADKFKNLYS